ncbi:S1C family serine protease [Salinarimonas soli]|uniref:Trypsin-like serine protease n=1 Tax=Salinarimonas soli TaxID=1638099 RepID=A0A5B2W1R9_9HYPH|nr:trypsin-like peptidase domain-containing protein [Salinarimonas soli]KAA2244159.1 trypsin-like serine protease [Salinarimonas soli]
MSDRLTRFALLAALLLLAAFVAEPYIARYLLTADAPRVVAARGDLAPSETAAVELFQRVSPSVVHVFAQPDPRALAAPDPNDPFGAGPEGGGGGQQSGTGFIWDRAGHVVTNNHVVQGASSVSIRLSSGDVVPATIVGLAPNYDLAVLRLGRVREPPPAIAIGSSGDLKVGQSVFAIGNPFGLDQTLTTGIVSALQRRLPTSEGREIADVIQTDAAINPGNSGGPLLDSAGRVIGVNTAIYSPSGASAGIGFAIPIDVVNRVVPQLINTGRVPTPGLGIIAGNEAAAARLGIEGVVIVRTMPGSPAARAGLRPVDPRTGEIGDVIVAMNDRPVRRLSDLTAALQGIGVGQTVQITVDRGGRQAWVPVEVGDMGTAR